MVPSPVPVPLKTNYADTFWCTYCVSVIAASIAEVGKNLYKLNFIIVMCLAMSISFVFCIVNSFIIVMDM
jgi:hypothetical protein